MRISKVYTRTGDAGKTRLAGGQEVWKDSVRVEAYGTVDELNSMLGLARVSNEQTGTNAEASEFIENLLKWTQNKLFDLGGILATAPGESFPNMPTVSPEDVVHLEHLIDECQKDLAPLKEFICLVADRLPRCSMLPVRFVVVPNVCVSSCLRKNRFPRNW